MCSYAYIILDQTQIDLNRYFISPAKVYQEHIFFIYKGYGGLSLGYLALESSNMYSQQIL